jgi:signal transduction histidine kinase/tetratricopeptide (TPR) repeat protein
MIFHLIKKPSTLLTVLLLLGINALAQQKKIDSLQLVIRNSIGLEKYFSLTALARQYAGISDNATAYKVAVEARSLALQFGDTGKIVNSGRMVGQLLNRLSKAKEAETILLETLPIAKRHDRAEYKNVLNNLALAYTVQAKYDQALDLNFRTLILREEDKEEQEMNVSLNNIGFVYFKMKNVKKALEYFDRALALMEKMNEHYFLDRLLVNIGLCYNHLADYNKAKVYFDRAFKECGDDCSNQIKIEGGFGLGVSNFGKENYQEAIRHFKESYDISKKIDNTRFQCENLIYLGRIYLVRHESDSAFKALNECEKTSKDFGYNELLIETYKLFSAFFNESKNFEQASHYQNLYISLKDSIYSEVLIENLAKIQTNFAERENIKTIQDKEEVIERQRILNVAIVIIAILASLLIFVLYWSNHVKKKVNQALSDAKLIIEDQNRKLLSSNFNLDKELKEKNTELQKANESLSKVNDELDNFIYKTSHDIRGPLASLKGMCNVALMDVKDQVALSYLKKLDITADKLNTILTRLLIVNQINNSALASERIDFEEIIHDLLLLEKKKGLPSKLAIKKNIDPSIEYYSDKEFVRIILENLIDNAIKFYNDSERVSPFVEISIMEEKNFVKIKVLDNGIGISQVQPDKIFQMFSRASERSETGGIGLYITKTASEKLGGIVNLKTTPEGFTEFSVSLPLTGTKVMA